MADMTLQGLLGAADGVTQSFLTQTYPAIAGAISAPITYAAILYWAPIALIASSLLWNAVRQIGLPPAKVKS